MKTYTYKIKSNTSSNTFPAKEINWSKILDDILTTNIKKNNSYLNTSYKNDPISFTNLIFNTKTFDDEFAKAAKFLANYKKTPDTKFKYIIGKTYKLPNGKSIVFYDDEIQIGSDIYTYDDFNDMYILNHLTPETKKDIISLHIKITL